MRVILTRAFITQRGHKGQQDQQWRLTRRNYWHG